MNSKPYTFNWPGWSGPEVERFETLAELATFLAGWCRSKPELIMCVSVFDWRG